MILTPNILARLVAIVLLGVLLQLSFFSQVAVLHTTPDVLPALVVSLGLLGGSMTGAVCGFSLGFLLDCLLIAPLGGGSLVLLGTGYLAGVFRERFEINNQLMVPLLCVAGTLFAELGFGAVQLMLGHRRAGQHPGRARHADPERLRLLPRLADLPRRQARPAPGSGRGSGGAARTPAPADADGDGNLRCRWT